MNLPLLMTIIVSLVAGFHLAFLAMYVLLTDQADRREERREKIYELRGKEW